MRRWLVLAVIAAFLFVLGFIGWIEFFDIAGKSVSIFSLFQLTFGLFIRETFFPGFADILNLADYRIPLFLDIARIVAPWITLSVFITLVLSLLRNLTTVLAIRLFYRNHIVVISDDVNSNYLLNCVRLDFLDSKIVLLKDTKVQDFSCRRFEDIPVISGNIEDPSILKITAINRAKHIVIATNDDSVNVRLLRSIEHTLSRKRKKKNIEIWLQIEDFKSFETFKGYKGEDPSLGTDVHIFSVFQRIAADTVDRFSPDRYDTTGGSQREIAVLGLDTLGQWLVLEAAQMYHFANMKKLRVTIIDSEIENKVKSLLRICPLLKRVIEINPVELLDFLQMDSPESFSNVSTFFIAWEKIEEIEYISRKTRQLFFNSRESLESPAIVLADISSCLCSEIMKESLETLEAIGVTVSRPAGISIKNEEECDCLAMQIHNVYSNLSQKELELEWSNMNDYFKDENRYAARHLPIKLRSLGLEAVPTDDPREAVDFKEILERSEQLLARLEHDRWLARKLVNGYIHGKKLERKLRDRLKIHVDIRPWEELSEKDREKDLVVLRNIENMLREIGKKIVPIKY
ncbi:MAG TPA: NAD-binding protein [Mesotoga sp.]|nr:NAD-binding protein [Mesotoga sp.]